jgi:hypothetical protein
VPSARARVCRDPLEIWQIVSCCVCVPSGTRMIHTHIHTARHVVCFSHLVA